jgi:hypothetical protein
MGECNGRGGTAQNKIYPQWGYLKNHFKDELKY